MNLRDVIREFIVTECLQGEGDSLTDDTPLKADGILDSLTTLRLVEILEEHAGVKIAARDVNDKNFADITSILAFVEQRRAAK